MFKKLIFVAALSFAAFGVTGCAANAADVDDTAESEVELTLDGAVQNITWNYTRKTRSMDIETGQGLTHVAPPDYAVAERLTVPGQVAVRLIGDPFTTDTSFGPLTFQKASVAIRMPDFEDPSRLVTRRYLVEFLTHDAYGAEIFDIQGALGSTVVDRSIPGAQSIFAAPKTPMNLANGVDSLRMTLIKNDSDSFWHDIAIGSTTFVRGNERHHVILESKYLETSE